MKTSELLDELQGNILRDVSNAVTGQGATLWTPVSLVRYLDDAQVKMAVYTQCIADASTTEVTEVTLTAGVPVYPLHESVLSVLSARYGDRYSGPIMRRATGYELYDGASATTSQSPLSRIGASGTPRKFSMDEETGVIRVHPTPSPDEDGAKVYLRVARKPLERLVVPVDGQPETDLTPEVPSEYHLDLCEWAAYRALRNHDVDAEDLQKASTHRNQWQRVLEELKRHMRRTRQVPATFGGRVYN